MIILDINVTHNVTMWCSWNFSQEKFDLLDKLDFINLGDFNIDKNKISGKGKILKHHEKNVLHSFHYPRAVHK